MGYIPVILPLVAGAIFALAVFIRRGTRPKSKRELVRLTVIAAGFLLIAAAAAINIALNGRVV